MAKEIEIPEGYEAKIDGNKVILIPKESKDERIRTRLIALVEAFGQGEYKDEMLAYLERQKEQKPAEWSEEDERTLESFLGWLQGSMGEKTYSSWLKSLPERFSLKPKQEWSEEDENWSKYLLDELYAGLKDYCGAAEKDMKEAIKWFKTRLKSLRPQPHWKPSEYTLSLVKKVANGEMLTHMEQMAMETLCNDLQKLL